MTLIDFGYPTVMSRLVRVSPTAPGLRRVRSGRSFRYVDCRGTRVTDPDTLERIAALVLPPAWQDVWICTRPNGHLQAVGTDAAGRRQYRYHDAWRVSRDLEKFEHVLDVGERLPHVRAVVGDQLASTALSRDQVLGCAVRLLDLGFFRVGSEQYAARNGTYGLATLRKDHVKVSREGVLTFDYIAKSGKQRVQSLAEPEVVAVVQSLKLRRGGGPELLAYQAGGRWVDVKSSDINEHLRELAGIDVTAKDFRTWSATVLASVGLAVSADRSSVAARKRAVTRVVHEVSHYLGNTPAVCRSSYIDPRVIELFEEGRTVERELLNLGEDVRPGHPATQGSVEAAVLKLLRPGSTRRTVGV